MFPEQCVILVGGRGSRLGALTEQTPKPLMPVAGRPFLDYLLDHVTAFPLRRIILLAGYLGDALRAGYEGRVVAGARIEVVVEPEPLGTGGALTVAADRLDERFFLLNGDSLFDVDLADLADLPAADGWLGKLALRRIDDTSRSGLVDLAGGRITAFQERGPGGPGLINGGVYLLDRRLLSRIAGVPCSIERDLFPGLAAEGRLHGKLYDGYFIDIGVPQDLARAQTELPARRPLSSASPPPA